MAKIGIVKFITMTNKRYKNFDRLVNAGFVLLFSSQLMIIFIY